MNLDQRRRPGWVGFAPILPPAPWRRAGGFRDTMDAAAEPEPICRGERVVHVELQTGCGGRHCRRASEVGSDQAEGAHRSLLFLPFRKASRQYRNAEGAGSSSNDEPAKSARSAFLIYSTPRTRAL